MLKVFYLFFLLLMLALSSIGCIPIGEPSTPAPGTLTQTEPARSASMTPEPSSTQSARLCLVTAQEALNLREGAGVSFAVIGWLSPGDTLTLTSSPAQGSWIEVLTETGSKGWINSKYCKIGE